MEQSRFSIARKKLAVLTILSIITPVSVYAKVIQCRNCHEWIDERNIEHSLKLDLSTGFYCNRPACQRARKKESKQNTEFLRDATRHVEKLKAEGKEKDRLCQAKLDEFCAQMKDARKKNISSAVVIPLIEQYLAELQELKRDKNEGKYLSQDYATLVQSMSKIDFYPDFWRAVSVYGDMAVIRHFWPGVKNAKEYAKYYKKYGSRCNHRWGRISDPRSHKTGIAPFSLGPDPTTSGEPILFCDDHARQIFLDLIKIGDVEKLAYFMEQCSPDSDFIIIDFLASIEGKDVGDHLALLRSKYANARNSIERKEYEAKIKQCEADLTPKFEIHPDAWQFIINNLSENAYTDIILAWHPDKIYCALNADREIHLFSSTEGAREYLTKKMLQTHSPQLDRYNTYLNFLQRVKDAEKNAGIWVETGFLVKHVYAPYYPVEVLIFSGNPSADGKRIFKKVEVFANVQNPLIPGHIFKVYGNGYSKWVWQPGLMHKNLPYRSRKEDRRWDWVPGLTSSMAPGYLSGQEEFNWVWTPGLIHPRDPSLVSGNQVNSWNIIPGYDRKPREMPKWVPGTKHPDYINVVSGKTPRSWVPAKGYQWKNPDDNKDFSVVKKTK